jgi:hypothetical protein
MCIERNGIGGIARRISRPRVRIEYDFVGARDKRQSQLGLVDYGEKIRAYARRGPSYRRIDVGRLIVRVGACVGSRVNGVIVRVCACVYMWNRVSIYERQASSSLITKIPTFENA